ncbi:hypothetical protein E2C01_028634 [Portunus trituberculatus]|uniref:Uncharacterized protein n=1 Tax=Portunus trituberculatus TaxID=210409 RepID=A0A5B7EPK0_PORTR|nr:hypothetical protein [Portunus trituberculatus]
MSSWCDGVVLWCRIRLVYSISVVKSSCLGNIVVEVEVLVSGGSLKVEVPLMFRLYQLGDLRRYYVDLPWNDYCFHSCLAGGGILQTAGFFCGMSFGFWRPPLLAGEARGRITTRMEKDVPSAIRPVPALGRRGRYVDASCRRPAGWGLGAAGGSPRRAAGTSRSLAGHFLDSNSWKVSIKFGS